MRLRLSTINSKFQSQAFFNHGWYNRDPFSVPSRSGPSMTSLCCTCRSFLSNICNASRKTNTQCLSELTGLWSEGEEIEGSWPSSIRSPLEEASESLKELLMPLEDITDTRIRSQRKTRCRYKSPYSPTFNRGAEEHNR